MYRSQNSFDAIRFLASMFVLLSHHFALSGQPEPYVSIAHDTLGALGVMMFFCISGFLIFGSILRHSDWLYYLSSRILRIFPAMFFCISITSLLALFIFSNYQNLIEHFRYIAHNFLMMFFGVQYEINGILSNRIYSGVNGSLWTMPYELWLYVLIFIVGAFRCILSLFVLVLIYFIFVNLWANGSWLESVGIFHSGISTLPLGKLGSFFVAGAIFSWFDFYSGLFQRYLTFRYLGLLVGFFCVLVSAHCIEFLEFLFPIGFAGLVLLLCKSHAISFFSKGGDPSYGIYLYAFPIQQICILMTQSFTVSLFMAIILTIFAGYSSWHFLEKSLLSRKSDFLIFLRSFSRYLSKLAKND